MSLPYAEDINYWKTGHSDPDKWIERATIQIENLGGQIISWAFGNDALTGRAAYMILFQIDEDRFRCVWPVLPIKKIKDEKKDTKAARIQAATMLYHDVKQRCITSTVIGARSAFFSNLLLPDGRTASEASVPELTKGIPQFLLSNGGK